MHRLLIVEDHPVMRAGYKQFFDTVDDVEVGAIMDTAEEALALSDEAGSDFPFELALIDISLPGMDGLELVRRLRQTRPTLLTLVVTGHHEGRYQAEADLAGASGFVQKGNPLHLLEAIHGVLGR